MSKAQKSKKPAKKSKSSVSPSKDKIKKVEPQKKKDIKAKQAAKPASPLKAASPVKASKVDTRKPSADAATSGKKGFASEKGGKVTKASPPVAKASPGVTKSAHPTKPAPVTKAAAPVSKATATKAKAQPPTKNQKAKPASFASGTSQKVKEESKSAKGAAKISQPAASSKPEPSKRGKEPTAEDLQEAALDESLLNLEDLEPEEVVLTDAEGRRYCKVKECDQLASVDKYCRYHYLLFWKKIQLRKRILADGKLEKYIEDLTSRYPDKYIDMIRRDLKSEKDFLSAIQELEIDDSGLENDFEEESENLMEEVRGISRTGGSGRDEDDY